MGIDEGFDMVPRLTRSREDVRKWKAFIDSVQNSYRDDAQVKLRDSYIEFEAGEHPLLPFDGHKFLRFSSKVTGGIASKTNVSAYLRDVRLAAISIFGSRVRPWSEAHDDYGFYDWLDVHDSIKSYSKGDDTMTPDRFAGDVDNYPMMSLDDKLFEKLKIPDKGNGLVARCNIRKGTRILSEKPLFVAPSTGPEQLHKTVATKLKTALTEAQKRQFLSLHNNFPGRHAFAGIVRTNGLPCGSGAREGGVYAVLSLVNHSCLPNCHTSWNPATRQETLHAARDVLAGEELTIAYDHGEALAARQEWLRSNFGFDCRCELCVLPAAELRASDARRAQIKRLYEEVGNPFTMMAEPLASLRACRKLVEVSTEEYGAGAAARVASPYYDAFQIVVTHGDQARARVFAKRSYEARVVVEGEDNPESKRVRGFMEDPSSHPAFAMGSKRWNTSKTSQPSNLGVDEFEDWLWRQ